MNFKKFPVGKLGIFLCISTGLLSLYEFCPAPKKAKSIDLSSMDKTVSPGTDFYQYANGNWVKNNPVPATESSWNSFSELAEKNKGVLRKILEDDAANTKARKGSNAQKIGDFYFTGMDSVTIDKQGMEPLKSEFNRIENISDKKSLILAQQHQTEIGASTLFNFFVEIDDKVSSQYIAKVGQGGLSLPGKEYYLNAGARNQNIREKYLEYVSNMFVKMGDSKEKAAANSNTVMAIETAIARNSMGRVEMRDPYATYHKMLVDDFAKTTPSIDWHTYITATGINPGLKEIIVAQPAFFVYLNKIMDSVPMHDWKTYMRWHLINSMASSLSSDFDKEHFRFYGGVLTGVKVQQPRWKRILASTDESIGMLLAQEYVKEAFPPEAKAKALKMVKNLQAELKERILALDWMGKETKDKALQKLDKMMIKIGYPDKWKDYSGLEITRASYVSNEINVNEFEYRYNMNKWGKPIDRTEWGMTPPTINAYYNPSLNEIVFPAGILQFPFFDPKADDAVNYGGIGAVIGHEMTHGFDDQGRQFDADGNLKDWWTKEDADNYEKRTKIVVAQFNGFVPLDTMHINGQLTLGENIADLGGITVSYYAYMKSLEGKRVENIDGYTPEQRFFIAFAQLWKGNMRPEALARQLVTNPHSPGKYRVLGPLANMPEFQKAFGLKEGDAMVRAVDKRAQIW